MEIENGGARERSDPLAHTIPYFHRLITRFRMSAPARLYATRSSANSAVTLYNAFAEDLAAEASGSTPAPRRSKRIKAEDENEVPPVGSFAEDSGVTTPRSGRTAKRVKVEHAAETNAEDEAAPPKRRTKSPRPGAVKKQKPVKQSLDKPHPAPEHWQEQYDTIKSMRARLKAPVDTMGCDQAQNGETDPKVHMRCQGSPLNNYTLTPHRIVDLPLWCRLCFHRKRRTKSRTRPSPNFGLLWEAVSPLTGLSMQTSPLSLKRLRRLGSGDARRDT